MSIMHAGSAIMARSANIAGDIITLSGTTGSPNTSNDFAISTDNASVLWGFQADGTVDRHKTQGADVFDIFPGSQWCNQTPVLDYWIRWTHNAGDAANFGESSGTWRQMNTARNQGWEETTNGFATTSGSSKVEIATDASGSNIVATGYYGGTAEIEV
jgi:hypothetical protein